MNIPNINIWHILVGSMLDYPGNPSIVLFTKGCNMTCSFCHNLKAMEDSQIKTPSYIINILKYTPLCDAIVITGGEPCLQPHLIDFLKYIKSNFKYKVKLDTNGTYPVELEEVIDAQVIDYIAMDVKTQFNKYESLGYRGSTVSLEQSVDLIRQSGLPYQFRTTLYPELKTEDMEWIESNFSESERKSQPYRKP